ncbi:MAG: PIN domain-containing protein [Pseudomonadota bacterium]|nr:PIN domain-containing protein [Pseudomonadota bacterium]
MALISLDTNVVVYAFQAGARQDRALAILDEHPLVSVQVLNEYAHTSRRKFGRDWNDIVRDLEVVRSLAARIDPVRDEANRAALGIAGHYRLAFYDSLIIAVALAGGANTLYSEDMQHGLVIDGTLRIVDPFR